MKSIEINVNARVEMSKNELSRFRKDGKVPAILYGKHIEKNLPLSFEARNFNKILSTSGKSAILIFKSDDSKLNGTSALIKEVQRDALTDMLLNVDLVEIRKDEKISLSIPIEYFGEPAGAKQGGVVDIQRREINIECFPADIPENIKIDISGMNLNDVMHVSDLNLGDKVKVTDDKSFALISVKVVKEKVEAPAETLEGAEAGSEATATASPEAGKAEATSKGAAPKAAAPKAEEKAGKDKK